MVEYELKDLKITNNPKIAYLFDIDLIERRKYVNFPKLPNHALMKFSTYLKNKNYKIQLVYTSKNIPIYERRGNIYIGSALYSGNLNNFKERLKQINKIYKKSLKIENILIGTPVDRMPLEVDKGVCDYSIYDNMINTTGIKLQWWPRNMGFLTRGCYRHCKFCVNRDKNEIIPVNTLNEIYQIKKADIELLDDNLFSYEKAPILLHKIGEFSKKHNIKFRIRNGLDLRNITREKIEAIHDNQHAFVQLHTAWDETKNTYIFKNIMELRKAYNGDITCYILCGVNINTPEALYKDLLGLFYRFFCLYTINVTPYIAIFEDDTNQYQNKYLNLYKTIKRSYGHQRAATRTNLKRYNSMEYNEITEEIIKILNKHSWLVTEKIGVIENDPLINRKLKKIAKELGVKHRDIIPKKKEIRI